VGEGNACPSGKFTTGNREVFCSGSREAWSTVWLHFCSLGPHSFPQQIAHWVPLLFGHQPSPYSSCAESFSSPCPTAGIQCSALLLWEVQTCKGISVYSVASLILGSQSSASCCLWGLGHVFPRFSVFTFLQVCGSSVQSLELPANCHLQLGLKCFLRKSILLLLR
jgi:hypothetical protein